jgi:hypothetical protein
MTSEQNKFFQNPNIVTETILPFYVYMWNSSSVLRDLKVFKNKFWGPEND